MGRCKLTKQQRLLKFLPEFSSNYSFTEIFRVIGAFLNPVCRAEIFPCNQSLSTVVLMLRGFLYVRSQYKRVAAKNECLICCFLDGISCRPSTRSHQSGEQPRFGECVPVLLWWAGELCQEGNLSEEICFLCRCVQLCFQWRWCDFFRSCICISGFANHSWVCSVFWLKLFKY